MRVVTFREMVRVFLGVLLLQSAVLQAGVWEGVSTESARILALKPNLENGLKLYEKNCVMCHEVEGWGSIYGGDFPQLAGQHQSVLVKQLLDMRDGKRVNLPMMEEVFSKKVLQSPQDFADVAAYVSALPMTTENGKGKDEDVMRGGEIYKKTCMACHGKHAEGNAKAVVPLLKSQHYGYMLTQFMAIKAGHRGNSDPAMTAVIQNLSDEDARGVLDYISRIKPAKSKRAAEWNFSSVMDQFKAH
ncbi:MAG: c-type cytochrome [Gammaproteobacteria bacterium]|nr:c-type cytochrome [Gammaproteobacteria bacterium]